MSPQQNELLLPLLLLLLLLPPLVPPLLPPLLLPLLLLPPPLLLLQAAESAPAPTQAITRQKSVLEFIM